MDILLKILFLLLIYSVFPKEDLVDNFPEYVERIAEKAVDDFLTLSDRQYIDHKSTLLL